MSFVGNSKLIYILVLGYTARYACTLESSKLSCCVPCLFTIATFWFPRCCIGCQTRAYIFSIFVGGFATSFTSFTIYTRGQGTKVALAFQVIFDSTSIIMSISDRLPCGLLNSEELVGVDCRFDNGDEI